MTTHTYRYVFGVILLFQVVYLALSLKYEHLPSWRMFLTIEKTQFRILTPTGSAIEYHKFLTPHANSFSKKQAIKFTSFVCRKSENSKLRLEIDYTETYEYEKPNCKPQ